MAQNTNLFWINVKKKRQEVAAMLQKGAKGQPTYSETNIAFDEAKPEVTWDNNAVYITSLRHNDRGTRAGFTVLTTVHLAGQRLEEQTHRLAESAEIEAYQKAQMIERKQIEDAGLKRNLQNFADTVGRFRSDAPAEEAPKDRGNKKDSAD